MTQRPRAVELGERFLRTLHDAGVEDRVQRLRSLCTPDATWWVDGGRDRQAGIRGVDPGDARPWPLHGTMRVDAKLGMLGDVSSFGFPRGIGARITRSFGTETTALVEAEGRGRHASGTLYQNRYAFVVDADESGITSLREYLDTMHSEDVFGGDRLSVPSVAPGPPSWPSVSARSAEEELSLSIWPAFSRGDLDAFESSFAPGATWWTDSGTDRDRGSFDHASTAADGSPFHGVVRMDEKLDYIRRRMAEGYGGRTIAVTPVRCFSEGALVATEAESWAEMPNGRTYQNRYVMVTEVGPRGIVQLREYCDTLHVSDVTGITVAAR